MSSLVDTVQQAIADSQDYTAKLTLLLASLTVPGISDGEIQTIKGQLISLGVGHTTGVTGFVSSIPGYSKPETTPNPVSEPLSMLASLTSTITDISNATQEVKNIVDFTTRFAAASPDDRKALAYSELVGAGWSVKINIDASGKTAELFNGTDVVNFITKGIIGGDVLSEEEILLGVAGKFEKSVFGFSVTEIAQDVETFAKSLTSGNVTADLLSGNLLGKITSILEKTGGNNDYVDKIKSTVQLAQGLINTYTQAQQTIQTAVSDFNSLKKDIENGIKIFDPPTTTVAPPDDTTTTTEAPSALPDVEAPPTQDDTTPPDDYEDPYTVVDDLDYA